MFSRDDIDNRQAVLVTMKDALEDLARLLFDIGLTMSPPLPEMPCHVAR